MIFLTEKMFKLVDSLFKFWVLLFEVVLDFDFFVKNSLFVGGVRKSLHKPLDEVLKFGGSGLVRDFILFGGSLIDKFNDSCAVLPIDFFFKDFVLILKEFNIFGLSIVLFFHLSF